MMMCLFKGLQGKRANHAGRNAIIISSRRILLCAYPVVRRHPVVKCRQTGRQTGRQTDVQTDSQIKRQQNTTNEKSTAPTVSL